MLECGGVSLRLQARLMTYDGDAHQKARSKLPMAGSLS